MSIQVNNHRALITYIDILGFRDFIRNQKAGEISRTIRLAREAIEPDGALAKQYGLTFQTFSDLTVISIPISKSTRTNAVSNRGLFVFQMIRLIHAQSRLINEGILLRGAVTVGDIVQSWGQLYGPGLIEAYDLERVRARFPRIVVNDNVFGELKVSPNLWMHDYQDETRMIRSLLGKEFDGVYFLDYLRAMAGEVDEPEEYVEFLSRHRKLIRRSTSVFGSIRRKRKVQMVIELS